MSYIVKSPDWVTDFISLCAYIYTRFKTKLYKALQTLQLHRKSHVIIH